MDDPIEAAAFRGDHAGTLGRFRRAGLAKEGALGRLDAAGEDLGTLT